MHRRRRVRRPHRDLVRPGRQEHVERPAATDGGEQPGRHRPVLRPDHDLGGPPGCRLAVCREDQVYLDFRLGEPEGAASAAGSAASRVPLGPGGGAIATVRTSAVSV